MTTLVETARESTHKLLGGGPDDVVVFTRNTTDALNLLAAATPGRVVVLDIEHHANLLPWRSRSVVTASHTIAETITSLEAELRREPAALLSVTGAANVTGETLPIALLAEIAHKHGARLAVDGAQLVPHREVSMTASAIDYLAFSGHKCYAPFGAGALVGKRDWLDQAAPYLYGGGAVAAVEVGNTEWLPAPDRHEAGTPNVFGIVALAEALEELHRIGLPARVAHERALMQSLDSGLAEIHEATRLRGFDDSTDAVGIATLELPHASVGLVAAALSAEHGVSVRAGRFCAHPFFDRIATRKNGLRVSVGIGTTSEHIESFLRGLATILTDGPRAKYAKTETGEWAPLNDDRRPPAEAVLLSSVRSPWI